MDPSEAGRRRFLGGAVACVAGVAGCLSRPDSDPGTASKTSEPADGTETTGRRIAGVTVRDVTVRPEVVALLTPDSIGPYGERGHQFLIADVAAAGDDAPTTDGFALEVGGGTFEPVTAVDGARIRQVRTEDGRADLYENGEGRLLFRCPKPVDAEGSELTWDGGEHALGEAAAAELGRSPASFEVAAFDVPKTVEAGTAVSISLTVTNDGDADGTFVAGLNSAGGGVAHAPETPVFLDVAAGESATWEYEYPDGDHVTFILHWRGGRLSRKVAVETE